MSNEYKDYMDDLRVNFDEQMDWIYDLPEKHNNRYKRDQKIQPRGHWIRVG